MGVKSAEIELTFEPAWSPANLSEEVRAELGLDDGYNFMDMMY